MALQQQKKLKAGEKIPHASQHINREFKKAQVFIERVPSN
jgi:hypothetical protein